jgi:DNA-binding response OmpR family regulator
MSAKSIWILEDDLQMQAIYEDMLSRHYKLTLFSNLQEFRNGLKSLTPPGLMILDLMCPDGSLHSMFDELAPKLQETPFLIVSGLDEQAAIRLSFKVGALDFISKPFSKSELQVKIDIFLNRLANQEGGISKVNLDPLSMTLFTKNARSSELTAKEYRILSLFLHVPDLIVPRKHLVMTLWKDINVSEKTLDVHLSNIRRKIIELGLTLVCTDAGYELQAAAQPSAPI